MPPTDDMVAMMVFRVTALLINNIMTRKPYIMAIGKPGKDKNRNKVIANISQPIHRFGFSFEKKLAQKR
ncbi:Uncharacterised protein [Mycobacteroides abscessus subsp. abscessus]|nr:Uncharacterised protein [Mycobacteroides abscessus subsp. abscessus]